MDVNTEYFEKFIVKKIVNTVDYNPKTDEYEINRIHISDDIIKIIEEEGLRYGFMRNQIGQIISQVSGNIRVEPSCKIRYDSIDVTQIPIGQHCKINILHPEKGGHYLELIAINKCHFYVLASDIAGLNYGDEIQALDATWNNGFYTDFTAYRRNTAKRNKKTTLRIGKIQYIEFFSPSVVHEILDSESTFSYDCFKKETELKDELNNKSDAKEYFIWIPNKWTPITFCWNEGDAQDKASTFIFMDNSDSSETKITISKDFQLPDDEKQRTWLMEILFVCCKWKNAFKGTENLKYIKTVKAGTAKRVESQLDHIEWELLTKPQIKFIYE